MADDWKPEEHHDTYTERVMRLIEDKREGRTVTPAESPPEATKVVDLFEALSRSVESRKGKGKKPEPAGRDEQAEQELSELSKPELERMARELGVKGRSKMNRAELEKAVRQAGRQQRRRPAS